MSINIQITILGISIVFLILVILYFLFIFMGKVFSNDKKKKKIPVENKVDYLHEEDEEFLADEEYEIIAAIISSIQSYSGKDFYIKSIKKCKDSKWKKSNPLKYWYLGRKRNAKKI